MNKFYNTSYIQWLSLAKLELKVAYAGRSRFLVTQASISPPTTKPVQATSERFLPTRAIFRADLANESHWLQPMLVLTIY